MDFVQFFFMCDITSLHAVKCSFYNTQKNIFLVQKYSDETQIIQDLIHFGHTPDMEWLIHYPKKGILVQF